MTFRQFLTKTLSNQWDVKVDPTQANTLVRCKKCAQPRKDRCIFLFLQKNGLRITLLRPFLFFCLVSLFESDALRATSFDQLQVMRNDQDGLALLSQLIQKRRDALHILTIKTARRFIQNENFRILY